MVIIFSLLDLLSFGFSAMKIKKAVPKSKFSICFQPEVIMEQFIPLLLVSLESSPALL